MAGLQDEQKRQAGVVAPSGRINRLPNAPLNNPLAQIDPAVRQAGMNLQNQQAQQPLARPQTALMQRQSPQMQAWAQGQQQQQQWMNTALAANGGTLNRQQARAALGQQGEAARAGLLAGLSANQQVRQAQPSAFDRFAQSIPKVQGLQDLSPYMGGDMSSAQNVIQAMHGQPQQAARALGAQIGQRYAVAAPQAPAAVQPTNPQGWGKTAYGANVVGRKTDNGYAFSNLAGDVQAAGNNRFKGRGGADGRISNNGGFNVMKSEDMWRDLGGSNPLAQLPAAPARYGSAERLPEGLQNIRSSGVNVVKSGADERNAQLKLRWQGEELIRQGKNTRRARGSQQMVQAGAQMVDRAAGIPLSRQAVQDAQRHQAAELESRERMNQGRQGLEQAQAAALEQQTQSAQVAQQAQQQQAQRMQQLQALIANPSTPPEQRQLASQYLEMMTPPDPNRYKPYNLGEDGMGVNRGQGWFDTRTGRPLALGGEQGGLGELSEIQEGAIREDENGHLAQFHNGKWEVLRQ